MTALSILPVSYDYDGAAVATGYSRATIQQAVRAGDLTVRYPTIGGRTLTKPVIEYDELQRWVQAGAMERARCPARPSSPAPSCSGSLTRSASTRPGC